MLVKPPGCITKKPRVCGAYPQGRLSKKCLAEFAAVAANKIKSIFDRGVYLGENTYQAASVEFVRQRRTNYARSRLQKNCPEGMRCIPSGEDIGFI